MPSGKARTRGKNEKYRLELCGPREMLAGTNFVPKKGTRVIYRTYRLDNTGRQRIFEITRILQEDERYPRSADLFMVAEQKGRNELRLNFGVGNVNVESNQDVEIEIINPDKIIVDLPENYRPAATKFLKPLQTTKVFTHADE